MNLPSSRQLHPVQPIEPTQQCVWVILDMLIVILEHAQQELVLGVVDGLDDEAIVAGEIEEGPGFSGGTQLG